MPALPNVPGVLKVNVDWGVDGDSMAQTVHFARYTGTCDAIDASSLANEILNGAVGILDVLCTSFTGMLSATVRDLASDMGVEVTGGTPWTGSRTGDRLSPGTAFCHAHQIARHYRGGHARTYFPFGSGTDVAATGLWADAFVTDASNGAHNWFSDWTNNTYGSLVVGKLCQVSYYGPPNRTITSSGGRVRTVSTVRAAPIVNDIVGSVGRKVIASQRRRNRDA
jgi:hypothetical protein